MNITSKIFNSIFHSFSEVNIWQGVTGFRSSIAELEFAEVL